MAVAYFYKIWQMVFYDFLIVESLYIRWEKCQKVTEIRATRDHASTLGDSWDFFPHFIIAFISFYRYYSKRKEKSPVSGTILTCQKASRVFKDLGTTQNMVSYFLRSKSDVAKWLHIFDRIYRNLLCHIGSFYSKEKK